ncbi:MAG TPA: hypothetical protein VII76_16545 [Acidimicrobiales bacterium]
MATRVFAPVAAPPPPKPPQLNLVASALIPDVDTDTLDVGDAPTLASAGWMRTVDQTGEAPRRMWHRPPGDELYRARAEQHNALVAAIDAMSDVEMKQAEEDAGINPNSLPASLFPAAADSRWTGGFSYAPENQFAGILRDTCNGTTIDRPLLHPANLPAPAGPAATPSSSGGTLTAAASPYGYVVTALTATGGQGTGTASFTGTIASGSGGSNALAWSAVTDAVGYAVYRNGILIATVTGTSFTDTGAGSPTLQVKVGNLPMVHTVPFLIQVEDECSAWGWSVRDYVGRALRLLDNATPNAIETEFWMGLFSQQLYSSLPGDVQAVGANAFLTQSGTPSSGGTTLAPVDLTPGSTPSITRGLQILEDYLANSGFGGQGMLHVAPETSPNLLGARRVGALLLSVMDNIIVPGSGYPTSGATGPAGNADATPPTGEQWIYATDLVSVRLDTPMVFPGSFAEALDRGTSGEPNLIRFRAQRFAAVSFDVARLAACRVTLAS